MCLASRRTRPSALVLATRSDPARSTKFSLDLWGGVSEGNGHVIMMSLLPTLDIISLVECEGMDIVSKQGSLLHILHLFSV